MGAANGFVTTRPDARYGDTNTSGSLRAQKFVCGGVGSQEVTRIGGWMRAAGSVTPYHVRLAIFTHDAANDCPDTLVADSLSDELSLTYHVSTELEHSFEYVTRPALTGGSTYWLAVIHDAAANWYVSRFASGGSGVYLSTFTYPTFPSGDGWHAHTNSTSDVSLYAVYQGVASAVPTVTTQAVSGIGATGGTLNGTITATGGGDADERGFVIDLGTQADPGNVAPAASGYASAVWSSGSFGVGAFTVHQGGLASSTTFYVRAFAHNSAGYSYGAEVTFDTLAASGGAPRMLMMGVG
jgi:hypothetical protein